MEYGVYPMHFRMVGAYDSIPIVYWFGMEFMECNWVWSTQMHQRGVGTDFGTDFG